jgi:hypothetical protein
VQKEIFEEITRFSSIQIHPFNSPENFCKNSELSLDAPHKAYSTYKDQYGLGDIFSYRYPPEQEIGNENIIGSHLNILSQLNKYTERFGNELTRKKPDEIPNTLLVRLRFLKESTKGHEKEDCVEFYLGVFTSGREQLRKENLESLNDKILEATIKQLRNMYESKNLILNQEVKNGFLAIAKHESIQSFCKSVEGSLSTYRYNRRTMKLSVNENRLMILPFISLGVYIDPSSSQSRTYTEDEYKRDVTERLFSDLYVEPTISLDTAVTVPGALAQVFSAKSGNESSITNDADVESNSEYKYEQQQSHKRMQIIIEREKRAHELFMRPCYATIDNRKGCLGDEFKDCHFHSESCFLTALVTEPPISDVIEKIRGDFDESKSDNVNKCYECIVDLYSYRDICRICRGTLSIMLSNGQFHKHISKFMKNQKQTALNLSEEIKAITVYAHSIKTATFT